MRECEQGRLPGYAALLIRVVVELVHDDIVDFGLRTVTQGDVGENLCSAAENGGTTIDAGITSHHADVLRSKIATEREEFFIH